MNDTLPALHDTFLPDLPSSLERRIVHLLEQKMPAVLLTITQTTGHAARKAGTRALFTGQTLEGTLGGGLFEKRVIEEATQCFAKKESCLFSYSGVDDAGRGKRDVLCEYLSSDSLPLFAVATTLLEEEKRAAWMIDITRPSNPLRSLVLGETPNPLPASWHELLFSGKVLQDARFLAKILHKSAGKALIQKDAKNELYLEPFQIPTILLLCGAGHLAKATAALASRCGFTVDIVDERTDLDPALNAITRSIFHTEGYTNLVQTCKIGQQHFVVIMTPTHEDDQKCLRQILASHAAYIGMIGSTAKREAIYSHLKEEGVPATELAAVHCPVGLQIGAETPEQIAVSIVAELLAAKSGTLKLLTK